MSAPSTSASAGAGGTGAGGTGAGGMGGPGGVPADPAASGIWIDCPTRILLGSAICGLAISRSASRIPKRLAIFDRLSPGLIVYVIGPLRRAVIAYPAPRGH